MISKLPFGKTGHDSSRLILGAAAFWDVDAKVAADAVARALDAGVNHIDVAASYGRAQETIGPVIPGIRDRIFLATKTEKRSYKDAMADLDASLRLLKTDHIDLWQIHCMIKDDEWETAMGKDGALRAFEEARAAGKVRFLGITSHGHTAPFVHMKSLERFPFDSVLLPWNYALSRNAEYRNGFEKLRALCAERGVALQMIKAFCRRPWGERDKTATTWYEPYRESADVKVCLDFAFDIPEAFVCSAGEVSIIPAMLSAASAPGPAPSGTAMAAFAERTGMSDLFED